MTRGAASLAAFLRPPPHACCAEANLKPSDVTGTGPGGRILKEDAAPHSQGHQDDQETGASDQPTTGDRRFDPRTDVAGPQADRDAPARTPEHDRHAHDLQRSRHVRGHGPAGASTRSSFEKKHGVKLGFMSFFVKAAVEALKAFPLVNARIDGNDIVHQNFYDIGVAVSTEKGLMVPVLRDADQLGFAEIEKAIGELAEEGPRRQDHRHRPRGRHVHDHQRRHLRLDAVHADPEPAAEPRSSACTRSRSGRWW